MIEQTRFLGIVFSCSEFKFIFAAKMFAVSLFAGTHVSLRIAGKTAKNAKIRTRKNFMPHVIKSEKENGIKRS